MGSRSPSALVRRARRRARARVRRRLRRRRGGRSRRCRRPARGSARSPARSRARSSSRARATAPGHRGVDFVAAAGTPVRAANAGEVTFAGNVAGSLHVVVAHPGGLRTSSSFLATIAVRRGQHGRARRRPRHRRGRDAATRRGPALRAPGRGPLRRPDGAVRAGGPHPADPARPGRRPRPRPASTRRRWSADRWPSRCTCRRGRGPAAPTTTRARSTRSASRWPTSPTALGRSPAGGPLEVLGGAATGCGAARSPRRSSRTRRRWRSGSSRGPARARLHRRHAPARERRRLRSPRDDRRRHQQQHRPGDRHRAADSTRTGSATAPARCSSFSYAPDGGPYTRASRPGPTCSVAADALAAPAPGAATRAPRPRGGSDRALPGRRGGRRVPRARLRRGRPDAAAARHRGHAVVAAAGRARRHRGRAGPRVGHGGRACSTRSTGAAGGAMPPTGGTSTAAAGRGLAVDPRLSPSAVARADRPHRRSARPTTSSSPPTTRRRRAPARVTVDPAGLSDHSAILRDPAALDAARLALEGRPLPCVGVATGVRGAVEPVVISRAERTAGAGRRRRRRTPPTHCSDKEDAP